MKSRKVIFGLLVHASLCSHAIAGLKYNDKYYSNSDIEQIMEVMSEPGIDDYGEFNRLRTELYEQADVQKDVLSEEEVAALAEYQDYAFASTRESFISGVFDDETQNIIDHIDSAFESGAKYQGVTFRGERELGLICQTYKLEILLVLAPMFQRLYQKMLPITFILASLQDLNCDRVKAVL